MESPVALVNHVTDDYVGKQALERIRREGVTRKLVGIELDGDPVEQPTQHWPAFSGGAVAALDALERCLPHEDAAAT